MITTLPFSGLRGIAALLTIVFGLFPASIIYAADNPLLDWSDWTRYRDQVAHPALDIQQEDIDRARRNIEKHAWARDYVAGTEKSLARYSDRMTSSYLVQMIPATTPLTSLFTPCPACRDQGKPYLPHGNWNWSPSAPERLRCNVCRTTFPHDKYPESVVIQSKWDPSQTFSWVGGETFQIFRWPHGRVSLSGNIRGHKVEFMSQLARQMALAHALTGKPEYAEASRRILLRFAEVYPRYMIHVAYGEIADMDPRTAAFSMKRLPTPEITYPPNEPDHKLFSGFWTAGRMLGNGSEEHALTRLVATYDLTCEARDSDGKPVYSEEDRLIIERDLLLESTIMLVADERINNKSIGNRACVGMIGASLGHPAMVRFGLGVFRHTVDDWFLSDGATPEGARYGLKGLNGIRELTLAMRNYCDPPGYLDASSQRYDGLNLFDVVGLKRIWNTHYNCLQGDLHFSPWADSNTHITIPPTQVEILATFFPHRPEYAAIAREWSEDGSNLRDAAAMILYRDPDADETTVPAIRLPDICPPELRIGFMRSGQDGRDSLLTLSASHWGVHHHEDSLNLYYWKQGRELLSDLGYMLDHPLKRNTARTLAHNLVMIDESDQEQEKRGGTVHFFETSAHVKVMRASSRAYPDAKTYRRTSALMDHGEGRSYVVDFFDIEGGETQDFLFHGLHGMEATGGLDFETYGEPLYDLESVRTADGGASWTAQWKMAEDSRFTAWCLPLEQEQVYIGDGWGQRHGDNRDIGTTIPYIIRRTRGEGLKRFVTVFEEGNPAAPFVNNVEIVRKDGTDPTTTVLLRVETAIGTDYIACGAADEASGLRVDESLNMPEGTFSAISVQSGETVWSFSTDELKLKKAR